MMALNPWLYAALAKLRHRSAGVLVRAAIMRLADGNDIAVRPRYQFGATRGA